MNSYIVMQGETYREEKRLGILRAPMKDKSGATPHSWERVKSLQKGDRTFHYVKGELVAVGTIQEDAREQALGTPYAEWLAPCEYLELDDPLEITSCIKIVSEHLPIKYSAFQPDGNGNSGYVYPCNEALALVFLELLSSSKWRNIEQLEFVYDAVREEKYNSLTAWMMDSDYLLRRKFRDLKKQFKIVQMERWQNKCAICGLDNPALLKAAYSKPWKDSSDAERIDPANGLLLCANHAALYESGQISFTGIGTLRMSAAIQSQASRYGLKKNMRIAANDSNTAFFRWHRNNFFVNE
ncbi:HNH endonuclease [Planococcus sp. CP5-4]|uniref:HNH endonuclease n=1 Tax=unclassified Planococcus (in: firmicutes) TaxID=2662419 RepID=UPI001C2303D5|nr:MULTISPECIES: HNH endonuclease [unclassified Planococcus (in: firmicutes)]MBU9674402.1 HNH endonuclease [Planococcus sp. CP5-4_YE]MBV0909010.1 HNH endonuclease [Planococcus sp. CP5-4_UN]MBW6065094.1 HNH endonuclease [Planococcus sp. CP5-4]